MPKYHFLAVKTPEHVLEGGFVRSPEFTWSVGAKSPQQAFDLLRALVLFPECFADPGEHRSDLESLPYGSGSTHGFQFDGKPVMDIPPFKVDVNVPLATISVWEKVADAIETQHGMRDGYRRLQTFPFHDAVDVTEDDVVPQRLMLGAAVSSAVTAPGALEQSEGGGGRSSIPPFNKALVRTQVLAAQKKERELQAMKREMDQALAQMKSQMAGLSRKIYLLSTFLGTEEEVVQIRDGKPAPDGTPLTLFQQVVYMDEEIGLYKAMGKLVTDGIDYTDYEFFDRWAVDHIDRYLHAPLSVAVFQIRRHGKEREVKDIADVLAKMEEDALNTQTFFVIRNGDRVSRVWSNVNIDQRLFPTATEILDIQEGKVRRMGLSTEQAVESVYQKYLPGVLYIQGLIERSPALGTHLRGEVNLLTQQGDHPLVHFVRDDEPAHWLDDGRPLWPEFLTANQEAIGVGDRVLCLQDGYKWYSGWRGGNEDNWRSSPARPNNYPDRTTPYVVTEANDDAEYNRLYFGYHFRFLYQPGDTIWGKSIWDEERERTRRVGWKVIKHEVIGLDQLTVSDIDYYYSNRRNRQWYQEMLPALLYARRIKMAERDEEQPFVDLVWNEVGSDGGPLTEEDVWQAVDWWKGKTKLARSVSDDDAKAFRMICKRLVRLEEARLAGETDSTYALVRRS